MHNPQRSIDTSKLNNYFGGHALTVEAWKDSKEFTLLVNDSNNSHLTKEEMYDLAMDVAETWEKKILKRAHLKIAYPLAVTNTSRDNQHNIGATHDIKDIPWYGFENKSGLKSI